jgi:hypothetical protein
MEVHPIYGTYELFRHFYALPPAKDGDGHDVAAVRGVLGSLLGMMQAGTTYIGVATDHVIESFQNRMWLGYKTGQGVEPELLAQFPLLEERRSARSESWCGRWRSIYVYHFNGSPYSEDLSTTILTLARYRLLSYSAKQRVEVVADSDLSSPDRVGVGHQFSPIRPCYGNGHSDIGDAGNIGKFSLKYIDLSLLCIHLGSGRW